jgi:hypothetical protein
MYSPHALEIKGHPTAPILDDTGNLIQMITVCGHCGATRSILLLVRDRWYCSKCRAEGATAPAMFPVA